MTRVWLLERKSACCSSRASRAPVAPPPVRVPAPAWRRSPFGWLNVSAPHPAPAEVDDVSLVLTLGSPLRPPPNAPGVIDQTRGILKYVDEFCPGPKDIQAAVSGAEPPHARSGSRDALAISVRPCARQDSRRGARSRGSRRASAPVFPRTVPPFPQGGRYVCLAGKYLKGSSNIRETAAWTVGLGYQQVCGNAEVWGDGITPVDWAHLDGAENVVLEGVYHSPLGAGPERPWCGPGARARAPPRLTAGGLLICVLFVSFLRTAGLSRAFLILSQVRNSGGSRTVGALHQRWGAGNNRRKQVKPASTSSSSRCSCWRRRRRRRRSQHAKSRLLSAAKEHHIN